MTQSDSPDFEFDISNLDVEGDAPSTSEPGGDASAQGAESSSPATANAESETSDSEVGEVRKIPPANQPLRSRELGEDDLGADVFSEIDDTAEVSLDDVLEDLMDEVETFEAGGYVDSDEESVSDGSMSGESPDIFRMEDPDDSLINAIDPSAPVEAKSQQPAQEAPATVPVAEDPAPAPSPAPQAEQSTAGTSPPDEVAPVPASEAVSASPPPAPATETSPTVTAPTDAPSDQAQAEEPEPAVAEPEVEAKAEQPEIDGHEKVLFAAQEDPIAEPEAEADSSPAIEEDPSTEDSVAALPHQEQEDVPEEEEDLSDLLESIDEPRDEAEQADSTESEAPVAAESEAEDETVSAASDASAAVELDQEGAQLESASEAEQEADSVSILEEILEEDDEDVSPPPLPELEDDLGEEDLGDLLENIDELSVAPVEEEEPVAAAESQEKEKAVSEAPDEVAEADSQPQEADADEEGETVSVPSADDLLRQAGSLLSKDAAPAENASSLLDDAEEGETISMPDPASLIAEADSEEVPVFEEEEEEVEAMPDPQSLIAEAASGEGPVEASSGNVADRAGDLPPPPPAPVEIIDEDFLEEDNDASASADAPDALPGMTVIDDDEEVEETPESDESEASQEEMEVMDPFDAEISLEDFNEGLADADSFENSLLSEDAQPDSDAEEEAVVSAAEGKAEVVEMPKPSLWWRVTHSMSIAAGFALLGAGWVFTLWKQEIVEYFADQDLDGSSLISEIQAIGAQALGGFNESGLYRLEWVDSEVRRVAENEIRLHALVGAQLTESLYKQVPDTELEEVFGYDETSLIEALSYAQEHFPEMMRDFPTRPWETLYRMTATGEETVPLRVVYSLTRENAHSDWKLSNVKVDGYRGKLVWPVGKPADEFGERAYDIASSAFDDLYAEHAARAEEYVANIDLLRKSRDESAALLARQNRERRERVMMSLAQGAFFKGMAILGEDGEAAREVTMVITEIRDGGSLVKGVFQVDGEQTERSKHFVGTVGFEKSLSGAERGVLNVTTVSLDNPLAYEDSNPFFDANTVSRIRLKTDGFRLEGDLSDISLRMTRSM